MNTDVTKLINANGNKLHFADRAAHGWYRFVLSFPPQLVRNYLARFGLNNDSCVLDPFCGTGSTLVECKKQGIPSVGIEAIPMEYFASKIKTDWKPDPEKLINHSHIIADETYMHLESEGIDDKLLMFAASKNTKLRSLDKERHKLLIKNSISALPLHKTLVLLDAINKNYNEEKSGHEVLALANTLVTKVGNLKFGPEVGIGTMKNDIGVVQAWLSEVYNISQDLRLLNSMNDTPSTLIYGDSRDLENLLPPCSVDSVITSPPYPNEKDYTRTTRLESVLLGFIRNRADLRAVKKLLIRSNTRGVYKLDHDDELIKEYPEIIRISNEIESRRVELGKTSGFERLYARVTKLYFGGLVRHLSSLRSRLRPGATLAYVVGDQASYLRVMINTGPILANIAESLGYRVESIDLFRTRYSTTTRSYLNEEVVVLRWK